MKCPNQQRNLFAPIGVTRKLQVLLAAVALGTVMSLRAESPTAPEDVPDPESEQMQAARQLHDDYVELQRRLAEIQHKAMQARPELQKQKQDFQALMLSKMSSSTGVDAEDEMAAIKEIEQKVRNKDTPDSERQKLIPEHQKRVTALRDAQIQVMQDPEVQQARAALMNATTDAMKQEDAQTEQLIEQLNQKQAELQKLMESGEPAQ